MEHQDWEPVVFNSKKKKGNHIDKTKGPTYTTPKYKEDENGIPIKKSFPKDFGQKMQQARADKGLSQKELAQKLNVTISTIQEYEQNKAVNPSRSFARKIELVLGSKLF